MLNPMFIPKRGLLEREEVEAEGGRVRRSRPPTPCLPGLNLTKGRLTPEAGRGTAGQVAERALTSSPHSELLNSRNCKMYCLTSSFRTIETAPISYSETREFESRGASLTPVARGDLNRRHLVQMKLHTTITLPHQMPKAGSKIFTQERRERTPSNGQSRGHERVAS